MRVFARCGWSIAAEHGLQDTTTNVDRLRKRIESGDAELWRIRSVECDGWLVTQIHPGELFVWCFQGRGFMPLVRSLARIALDNGLPRIGWFTYHVAPKRLFRLARPIVERTSAPGEYRYTLNCEDVWQLPRTLIDPSPSAQSAVIKSDSVRATTTAFTVPTIPTCTRQRARVSLERSRTQTDVAI